MPKGHGIALARLEGGQTVLVTSQSINHLSRYFESKLNGPGNAISHVKISEIDLFITPYF